MSDKNAKIIVLFIGLMTALNFYIHYGYEPPENSVGMNKYQFPHAFDNTALLAPRGNSPGFFILDMDEAYIEVTELGFPNNCTALGIYSKEGELLVGGGCVGPVK